jgi:hypothetical protein
MSEKELRSIAWGSEARKRKKGKELEKGGYLSCHQRAGEKPTTAGKRVDVENSRARIA